MNDDQHSGPDPEDGPDPEEDALCSLLTRGALVCFLVLGIVSCKQDEYRQQQALAGKFRKYLMSQFARDERFGNIDAKIQPKGPAGILLFGTVQNEQDLATLTNMVTKAPVKVRIEWRIQVEKPEKH